MLPHDELWHYGVKGMKWGVRKERYAERKATETSKALSDSAKRHTRAAKNLRTYIDAWDEDSREQTKRSKVAAKKGKKVRSKLHKQLAKVGKRQSDDLRIEELKEKERAVQAGKRAAGKKLSARDMRAKRELFNDRMTTAAALGAWGVSAKALGKMSGSALWDTVGGIALLSGLGLGIHGITSDSREVDPVALARAKNR